MSDTMLLGVLRIPPDLWTEGPIDQQQRHERYLQAADKIEQLRAEVERLRQLVVDARPFIAAAGHSAECRHDDFDGDYYMDLGQYEAMQQTAEWLSRADAALRGESD